TRARHSCAAQVEMIPVLVLLSRLLIDALMAQELPINGVNGYSLHPPYFNLAEGTKITATATCGVDENEQPIQDLYCKLVGGPVSGDPSQTIQGQYCDICTSEDTNKAHPINNAIDGTERWWQSPPLSRSEKYNQVNVTLDLGQLFHVAYVLIKFANSPRPDLWVLEHSIDFGKTYKPWQFFASSKRDCIERFGQRTTERINHDDDIICTTEYSRIVPLENGEIVVSLVNGRPGATNFSYSPVLREFTKATNIRLRFLRTNTLLGHLMGKALRDPTVTRRYYYSIKDISIGGRCVCNGHAEACNAQDPSDPYRLQCDCQHNTCGPSCERCCPGFNQFPWKPATTYSANECEPCNCHRHSSECYYDPEIEQRRASLNIQGQYRGGGVCIECQHHTTGINCERCIPGYYRSPDHPLESPFACSKCQCESEFTDGTCEDLTGRCYCKPNYTGENCDTCAEGYKVFPECYRNLMFADSLSVLSRFCRPNYSGPKCDQCAPGYYSYPSCTPCHCSVEGSRFSSCDPVSGQCVCLPNVVGQRCDSCSPGSYGFPLCQGDSQCLFCISQGSCECRPHVEGVACDRCKPLYWNLSPDTVYGCSSCDCNTLGTMSEVAECAQSTGQCYCKPNVCSGTCNVCKDGYFNLQKNNYFGCQGCQCDIGGSVGQACDEWHGKCRCRPNVEGPKCNQPRPDHYFPDLHHMKFEVEEGTTMDGHPVRFGYSPLEFESFSWRGYAQMSPIQNTVKMMVHVHEADMYLTRFILRYVNTRLAVSNGKITAYQNSRRGSEQSKQIVFAPTSEPTFVNVPQNSFVEPFVLNPGTWTVIIEAEGVLLDYLVLLPSAYYEAAILQLQVTEPCSYSNTQEASHKSVLQQLFVCICVCLLYCRSDNHLPRPCHTEKITPRHPSMAICSGNDKQGDCCLILQLIFFFFLHFSVHLLIDLCVCVCSFLCRAVSVDDQKRVAVFTLSTEADIQLSTDRSSFFLHKVFLIPRAQFTMEYLKPRVHCISTHGLLCYIMHHYTQTLVFRLILVYFTCLQVSCFFSQKAVMYSTRVPALGRYVFILHYHQPLHPTYNVQVHINGGRIWQGDFCFITENAFLLTVTLCIPGHVNASFCPHGYGCRDVVMSENQITLDVTDYEVILTLHVPDRKTLWLDYVLVVPESTYSSSFLSEEPLDKSYDFISNCGQNSFYINPSTASPFCRNSAVSLSAFFNNGAVPCGCHEVGAESDTCETFGGQCKCRPNVIGRDCSQCATGYYGFPNCRPCNCGTRLCEPVTGECICPPRTLQPDCVTCEHQAFACHPLLGCEMCNCSRPGVASLEIGCDTHNGQCRCRNNIVGRQCDRCAPGFYGYPNCRPCDCSEAGTEIDVCDSITGRCLCKENVEGSRCDQCKLGTFHLDPTNTKGCTKCFCFGATDRCHSSDKRRSEIMDMAGWVLLRSDRQEVPVSTYLDQDLVEADLSDVPDVSQDLHWHAPHAYLGDKVSSYGGYLRYRLHTQTMRGDAFLITETTRPDVILKVRQSPSVNFRHAQTGNSVSREELMMVLVALESLQIRALHSQSAQSVSLSAAVLEGADNLPSGRHANNVEICLCPGNYLGDSCQKCSPGYYRDTKGLFLGKCVPCNCNGHSNECLDGSGICVNCRHNTAGSHCEQCQGGFHGNNIVDGHAVSCSSCPCPLFAIGCVEKPNHMQCLCSPGYAGSMCERCAPGYYGNPVVIGSTCQPCNCNGNSDPNMVFIDCHPLTGECQSCMHNSAGSATCFFSVFKMVDLVIHSCCLSVVVDRVKNETANRTLNNEAVAENIRNKLNQFNQQLMDLRDAMNKAVNNTANATEANNINQKRMEELQVFIQTHAHDYERLAAQLDGARQPLAEKVHKYASSANKIPLVEAAEKHAEMLDQLAKNLSSLISGSSQDGFIHRALNASHAYTNIINSVLEAETAAKKANESATEALEVQSTTHSVICAYIANDIEAAKSAVEQANNTVANVSNTLAPIQKQLEEWQKQYGDSNATSDDINRALNETNTSVAALSDILPQLMNKLDRLQNTSFPPSNISDSIQRIRQLIEQAHNAANKVHVSMKFNGNSGVQVRTPSNAANLAAYSSLHMYIKLPHATRTVRQATTNPQFVFYLGSKDVSQLPQPIPFVLYGMLMTSTKLSWRGGKRAHHYTLTSLILFSSCIYSTSTVFECRTLQYGQMTMYRDRDELNITKKVLKAEGEKGLLNLSDNETVFYVGGYPTNFTLPVELNMTSPNFFKGCLELISLNEELVSLYNFEQTFQMNTTADFPYVFMCVCIVCQFMREAHFTGEGYLGLKMDNVVDHPQELYAGIGFRTDQQNGLMFYRQGQVQIIQHTVSILNDVPHISVGVRVNSSSGLIVHVAGGKGQSTMTLSVFDGNLMLIVNDGKKTSIRSKKKYNDGLWHTVRMWVRHRKKVTVGGKSVFGAPLYIGGLPSDHSAAMVNTAGFVGCVRDLKLNEVPSKSPSHSVGVTPCYQQPLQPGVHFSSQGGYLTIGEPSDRTLHFQSQRWWTIEYTLFIVSGMSPYSSLKCVCSVQVTVLVNSGSGEFSVSLTPEESLCDGGWHTIASES
uniref:Laminin, alpha 5 n=1 Tax=Cyprinus carpio TaxID=7962 RepID=A0A8C1MUI0_CYPCA